MPCISYCIYKCVKKMKAIGITALYFKSRHMYIYQYELSIKNYYSTMLKEKREFICKSLTLFDNP